MAAHQSLVIFHMAWEASVMIRYYMYAYYTSFLMSDLWPPALNFHDTMQKLAVLIVSLIMIVMRGCFSVMLYQDVTTQCHHIRTINDYSSINHVILHYLNFLFQQVST